MSDKRFGLVNLGHRKLGENTTVALNAVTPPSVVSVSTQLGEGRLHSWAGEAAKRREDCGSSHALQ